MRSQSAQTLDLYIRPTPFDRNTALPQGMLIKKPYGGYYVTDMMFGYLPAVRPVTSTSALRSWQIDPGTAVEVYSDQFWDRIGRLEPLRFRPGSIAVPLGPDLGGQRRVPAPGALDGDVRAPGLQQSERRCRLGRRAGLAQGLAHAVEVAHSCS